MQGCVIGTEIGRRAHAVPLHVVTPEAAATERWMGLAKRDGQLEETVDVGKLCHPAPVEPRRLVVQVVRIAVAVLCLQKLVAGPKQRGPI